MSPVSSLVVLCMPHLYGKNSRMIADSKIATFMSASGASRIYNLSGRVAFVAKFRECWPTKFWKPLRELSQAHRTIALDGMFVDDWLRDACLQVLAALDSDPNLDVQSERLLLAYVPGEPSMPHVFEPVLKDPFVKNDGICSPADLLALIGEPLLPSVLRDLAANVESIEDFEARMQSEFNAQLREYIRSYRQTFDDRQQLIRDALWTALVFGGLPRAELARSVPELRRNRDAEATVGKAVARFATAIGLTLPDQTRVKKSVGDFVGT